jgi:hypothetical protein
MSSIMGSVIRRIVVHTTVAPARISVVVVVVVVVVVGGCWRLLLLLPKSLVVMPTTNGATNGRKLRVPL